MTLDIRENLESGFRRAYTDNGIIFTAAFLLLSVLNTGVALAFTGLQLGPSMSPGTVLQLIGLVLFSTALGIASIITAISAVRVLTTDEEKTVPPETYRENLMTPFINLVVGGIASAILITAGLILFVIPGIILMIGLVYWQFFVIVDGQNFVEGMRSSWELTEGRKLRVFGLLAAAVVVALVITMVFTIPALFIGNIGILVSQVGNAFATVFLIAVLAESFNQLKNE